MNKKLAKIISVANSMERKILRQAGLDEDDELDPDLASTEFEDEIDEEDEYDEDEAYQAETAGSSRIDFSSIVDIENMTEDELMKTKYSLEKKIRDLRSRGGEVPESLYKNYEEIDAVLGSVFSDEYENDF